jgi:hypothetical protein
MDGWMMAVQVGRGLMIRWMDVSEMDVLGRTAGRTYSDWDICTDGVQLREVRQSQVHSICAEEGKLSGQRPLPL